MKEQIKELVSRAGTDTSGKWMSIDNAEKFAELIVKECCQKLEDNGMVEIAIEMKQHFGVEE